MTIIKCTTSYRVPTVIKTALSMVGSVWIHLWWLFTGSQLYIQNNSIYLYGVPDVVFFNCMRDKRAVVLSDPCSISDMRTSESLLVKWCACGYTRCSPAYKDGLTMISSVLSTACAHIWLREKSGEASLLTITHNQLITKFIINFHI